MKFLPVALSLLVAVASADLSHAEIRIGTAGPLSGQYAEFGRQIVQGTRLAVEDINAAGGVNGEQLVLETADDGCDPRKALEAAQDLIGKGVVFVAGHYCSFASIPAAPLYAKAGIVMISPASTHPKFTDEGGWNVHRVCARDDAQGTFAGEYMARTYRNGKIALIDDGSTYGKSLTGNVQKALSTASAGNVSAYTYKPGQKDFSGLAGQLKAAAPDVVYMAGYHPELGLLVKEMRSVGLAAAFISGDALVTDEFWTIAGDAADGMLMTFPPDPMSLESAAPIVARFKEQDTEPEGFTLHAYAAIQAWAAAARATDSTDSQKIALWLRAGNPLETVIGTLKMNTLGDVNRPEFIWYRWNAGKLGKDASVR